MKKPYLMLVLIPALVGLTAFLIGKNIRSPAAPSSSEGPKLETTELIDLGRVRPGDQTACVVLKNAGTRDLVVDQFSTSCSCTALLEDGSPISAKTFEGAAIPPGGEVRVRLRVSIRPALERTFRASISFRTNEDRRPQRTVTISAERQNPIRPEPAEVALGAVRPRQPITRTVHLRTGDGPSIVKVARVECSRPDLFTLRLRDAAESGDGGGTPAGRMVGDLEIVGHAPAEPQPLSAEVRVFEEGESLPSVTIPIAGVVHSRFVLSPSSVVLPNFTGRGPVYEFNCLCRHSDGRQFQIEVADAAGLRVVVAAAGEPRVIHSVRVEWPSDTACITGRNDTRTVRLRLRDDEATETAELAVTCRGPEDS